MSIIVEERVDQPPISGLSHLVCQGAVKKIPLPVEELLKETYDPTF